MDNTQRIASYGGQQKFSGTLLDLTPAQRRRVSHKGRSRKTHRHLSTAESLEVGGDGKVVKVPCRRCRPLGPPRMDSPGWRS